MYKVTIGLEIHAELNTKTKVFSSGINEYNEEANVNLNVVDLGYPGILPILNEEAVHKAILVSLALNCEIANEIKFDRKNYFYPDLPKGYQITQFHKPFGTNGYIMINNNEEDKKVLIHDLHLEEDTASLDHFKDYSLLNYNRAGSPLIEIVTEPCMHSSEEAVSFLETLRSILLYTNASDARSDRGQIRCDVNVSISDNEILGTKVEVKNINSFYNVKETIDYEIKRQMELLNKNEKIKQETRRFDANDKKTYSMREKVEAIDYKYFVEPNIPIIQIDKEYIEDIKKEIPVLPFERVNKYIKEYGLTRKEANTIVKDKDISNYFEESISIGCNPKDASNWITTKILGILNKESRKIKEFYLTPILLNELINLINDKKITTEQAKEVFSISVEENKTPKEVVEEKGFKVVDNDNLIKELSIKIIENNKEVVEVYFNGKVKMLDYLVGQIMKETKGEASPLRAKEIMLETLDNKK